MNSCYVVDVAYLRPSRTIETILLEDGILKAIVYVYNQDGLYFYFFRSFLELIHYLDDAFESERIFEEEEELEEFLMKIDLNDLGNFRLDL